jgi:hypothetical protein
MLNLVSVNGFENPELLWLVPVAWLAVFLLSFRSRTELHPPVLIAVSVSRSVLLTVLLFTLAGPYRMHDELDPVRWIVLRDTSRSMPDGADASFRRITARLESVEPDAELEVVRFARGAATAGEPAPGADASDPREAMQRARAAFRPDRRNRVLFFTDGRFSRHLLPADWPPVRPGLAGVYRTPCAFADRPDPRARALLLPPRVDEGAPFEIQARFVSDRACTGEIIVEGPMAKPLRRPVSFSGAGERFLTLRLEPLMEGRYPLRVTLNAPEDREPRNNVLEATLAVGPRPRVLVVDESGRDGGSVRTALEAQGFSVQVVKGPLRQEELRPFRAVILRNRTEPFERPTGDAIRSWVERRGGGLVVLGGPSGQGLRSFKNTPLEAVLPLIPLEPPPPPDPPRERKPKPRPPEPNPEKRGKKPAVFEDKGPASTITLLLLIDKSGSMGEISLESGLPAIQFAKEAAKETAETLSPQDRLGILAYDNRPRPFTVVPLGPVGDRTSVARRVDKLRAGGGTFFLPVLEMAYNLLRSDPSRIKHVILLTDGQRMDRERFQDDLFRRVVKRMTDRKITVSTVGVGTQVDGEFLANLATWGKGKWYYEPSADRITVVFTLEANRLLVRAGRKKNKPAKKKKDLDENEAPAPKPDEEPENPDPDRDKEKKNPDREPRTRPEREPTAAKPIPVRIARPHPILSGLPLPIPPVRGFDPSRPRPVAWTALETREKAEPILATGTFGLGKVVILTLDLGGIWSEDWLNWDGFSPFLAQTVRFVGTPPGPRPALPRDGRRHGPELDLIGEDPLGLARLDEITGARPLPRLTSGKWPGEPEQSREEPWPPYALLLAILLLPAEALLRRVSR